MTKPRWKRSKTLEGRLNLVFGTRPLYDHPDAPRVAHVVGWVNPKGFGRSDGYTGFVLRKGETEGLLVTDESVLRYAKSAVLAEAVARGLVPDPCKV